MFFSVFFFFSHSVFLLNAPVATNTSHSLTFPSFSLSFKPKAAILQALARCFLERRRYSKALHAAFVIQRCGRGAGPRRGLREAKQRSAAIQAMVRRRQKQAELKRKKQAQVRRRRRRC